MKNIFSVEFFIKKNGSKGSVTIFLTMILVPMLLLMITLTDYAKISVAKRQVSGAGDIALNAGLSYYDKKLQDMYGLFAVSKDVNSLRDNLEAYFKHTLLGEGIETTDPFVSKIVDIITGSKDSEDAYMNLINLTSRKFELKSIENANLANTTLLNNQIMDYMKYRGPVVLAGGLLEKTGLFRNAGKENKAIQKKVEFEEELDRTGDKCAKAYKKIKKYNEKIEEYSFSADRVKQFESEIKEIYKKAVTGIFLVSHNSYAEPEESKKGDGNYDGYSIEDLKKLLKNQFKNGSGYMDKLNAHMGLNGDTDNFTYVAGYIYSYNDLRDYFDKNIKGAGDAFLKALKNYEDNLSNDEELKDAADDVEKYIDNINVWNEGFGLKELNKIFPKPSKLKSYINILKAYHKDFRDYTKEDNKIMLDEIERLAINYYKSSDGYEDSGKEDEIKNSVNELKNKWNTYKDRRKKLQDDLDQYNGLKEKYKENLAYFGKGDTYSLYNAARNKKEAATAIIGNYIKEAENKKKGIDNEVTEIKKAARKAKNAMGDIINAFEKLENKRDNWQNQINTLSGESKSSMQADLKSEAGHIDKKQAEKCQENLEEICGMLDSLEEDIAKFKFNKGNTEKAAKDCADKETGKRNSAANSYYNNIYGNLSIDTKNIPKEIDKENNKFFGYLEKMYGDNGNDNYERDDEGEKKAETDKKEKEKTKDDLLKIDSDPDTPVETGNGSSGEVSGKNDLAGANESVKSKYASPGLPSVERNVAGKKPGGTSVGKDNISSSIGSAADSSLLNSLMSFTEKCVEDIYLTEYVMNMFTYRTYNKNPDGSAIEDAGLKTLSNCGYTAGILNGAEAEYVLWGLDTKKANLDATYTAIFGIRFLMNTVYAFMDKAIRAETLAAATAIAGWTGFGVPIVKTALTVGLALLESKLDMDALIRGKSVPVWKDKNTWVCSLSGFANKAASELINVATEKAQEAAEKAIDKIHNCAAENMNQLSDDMKKSLKDMTRDAITNVVNDVTSVIENKIMGIFDYGTDYASMPEDEIKEDVEKWAGELKTALGVPDSQPAPQNVSDYLLYKVYNGFINKTGFINKVTEEICKYKDVNNSDAGKCLKDLEEKVYKMCGIKKAENENGEEEITEVFGINTDNLIDDAISTVNSKVQSGLNKASETAKEEISGAISSYSEGLQNSLHKKPAASGTNRAGSKSLASSVTMDYSEYLTLLLLGTGAAGAGYTDHLLRTADLIQINIGIAKGDNKFALKNCKTHLHIEAIASGSTFFAGTKYLQEKDDIYLKKSDGLYGITYNGVDGY